MMAMSNKKAPARIIASCTDKNSANTTLIIIPKKLPIERH